jgi:transmembrane sensor
MTHMTSSETNITHEAADWLLRLEDPADVRCQAEFVAWLKLSPRHIDEFLMVETSYRALHQFDPQRRMDLNALVDSARAEVVPLRDKTDDTTKDKANSKVNKRPVFLPTRTPRRRLAYAATLAVVALGATLATLSLRSAPAYSTHVGEQRTFKLPDGSLLYLNTQSRVELHFSAQTREVRLLQGEALFQVKQEPTRPFRVLTGETTVQAIGTAFNVYRRTDGSALVSVVEGRVRVTTTPLSAGEEAKVLQNGEVIKNSAPDVSRTLAWRQRRLVFRETALEEIVAQFNRYNSELHIKLEAPSLAQRRITATFNADEPQALVNFLREDPSVRLDTAPGSVKIHLNSGP